ncbi:hypothetical protein KDA00_03580 [Candidatus Saccharibacteria bacterium]|nr:hypothetical protein [Candidatus Saccharibacteria bacterium]
MIKNTILVFVDFDETIFDHEKYIEWLDLYLHENHNIFPGSFKSTLWDYHSYIDDIHRLYDHEAHIKDLTGHSWSYISAEIESESIKKKLDFCYPEIHKSIQWLVNNKYDTRILTFGRGDYQRHKIYLCCDLTKMGIPVHVVNIPKREFIKNEFKNANGGFLIDDKYPLGIERPWKHIWLSRKSKVETPIIQKDGAIMVGSIEQAVNIITNSHGTE